MKKLMVFAGALALALGGWADTFTWFNADIANYTDWPTNNAAFGGTWSSDAGLSEAAELSGAAPAAALAVDADSTSPLEFTATKTKELAVSSESIEYSATVTFVPHATAPTTIPSDAKGGIVLVGSAAPYHFAVLVKDGDNNANKWVITSKDINDKDTAYDVKISVWTADNAPFISYSIGNEVLEDAGGTRQFSIYTGSDKKFSAVSISGCGSVSALSAQEDAVVNTLTIDDLSSKNLVVSSVTADGSEVEGNDSDYAIPYGANVVVTFTPAHGYLQSGASMTYSKNNMVEDFTITTETENLPTVEAAGARIGDDDPSSNDNFYTTVTEALRAFTNNATITVLKSHTSDGWNEKQWGQKTFKGLTLDLNNKTLSVNDNEATKKQFRFYSGSTVVIKNGTIARDGGTGDPIRSYATSLTLENVEINCSNVVENAMLWVNGDLILKGTTRFTNISNGVLAVDGGNYANASSYTMKTLTFDNLSNELAGDYVFGGGAVAVNGTAPTFAAGTKFYYAGYQGSSFDMCSVTNIGLFAAAGCTPTNRADSASGMSVAQGILYPTVAAAVEAVKTNIFITSISTNVLEQKVTLLGNVDGVNSLTLGNAITFDLNDKDLHIKSGDTVTVNAAIAFANTGATTGDEHGLQNDGTINVNETLDLSALQWGTGLKASSANTAKFVIAAGKALKLAEWTATEPKNDPNKMETLLPGFLSGSADGALFYNGATKWTFKKGDKWYADVASIELNKSATTIKVGASETLTATVLPADAVQTVTWTSSAMEVATVEGGVVTAVKAGTATITATAEGGKTATCTVTVEAAASTATVTITFGDGITKVTINDTVLTASGNVTLNQGTAYTAVAEYAEWYTNGTFTAGTYCTVDGLTITANAATADASIAATKIDPTVIEGTTDQAKTALGIKNDYIVNRTTLNASVNWAKNNGFTKAQISALTFNSDGDPTDSTAEAFLLNTTATESGLAAAKAAFKVTSITFDANGNPILGEPTATYNGNIVTYGSATPIAPTADGWTKVTDKTPMSSFKFFEFKLQLNTTPDNQ